MWRKLTVRIALLLARGRHTEKNYRGDRRDVGMENLDRIHAGYPHHGGGCVADDAADRLRDKFGEGSVGLAGGMRGSFRERTHENPAALPGQGKRKKK